jgi:DNA end-binding protein Ku
MEAMRQSGRCALAKWAWKAKQYVVQVRPAEGGLVLQQLLYADEVRSMKDLDIEKATISPAELKLAMQLIEQISEDTYDPTMFEDEEKKRILAAIDEKIAGKQIVAAEHVAPASGAQVIDLMEALRASLGTRGGAKAKAAPAKAAAVAAPAEPARERKGVKRAQKVEETTAPARVRAKK